MRYVAKFLWFFYLKNLRLVIHKKALNYSGCLNIYYSQCCSDFLFQNEWSSYFERSFLFWWSKFDLWEPSIIRFGWSTQNGVSIFYRARKIKSFLDFWTRRRKMADLTKSIEKLFNKIDTNKDQKLTEDELKVIMTSNFEKVGVEVTDEKLDRMVKSSFYKNTKKFFFQFFWIYNNKTNSWL